MQDISEITRADEEELLEKAKQRVGNFPILKRIYDNNFLSILVRNKHDYTNQLLYWLVTDNPIDKPIAICMFEEIEENLKLLQPEDGIQRFKVKLVQWDSIHFESALTELELAAEYKRKGYLIELEPSLPNGEKADFCASKDSTVIYFEVKCIFWERSLNQVAIVDEMLDRFGEMDEPFVIGIDLRAGYQRKQTARVVMYTKRRLREFSGARGSIILPLSFSYPENGEPIVVIDVHKKLPNGEKGFISGFNFGGRMKGDWSDLRSKISSAVSQLHPDYPGVIVVQPHGLGTGRYDVENALLGDLAWNPACKPEVFRWKDRIFAKNKNTRLNAVIYYMWRLQSVGYTMKKVVYHNPFAKVKLSTETFKGENTTQFVPMELDNGTVRYKQIDACKS